MGRISVDELGVSGFKLGYHMALSVKIRQLRL